MEAKRKLIPVEPSSYCECQQQPEFAEPQLCLEGEPLIAGIIARTKISTPNPAYFSTR
jgi:hypothetical protein